MTRQVPVRSNWTYAPLAPGKTAFLFTATDYDDRSQQPKADSRILSISGELKIHQDPFAPMMPLISIVTLVTATLELAATNGSLEHRGGV